MAKKKAARRAGRAAGKPVRKAARKAAGRARTAMKKVARRAASARKSAKTAMKKAARTTAKKTASMKKAATRQVKAAKKQVKTATKRVDLVVQKARAQQASVSKSASSAIGKAATLAKAVKAGVTAALTPPAAAPKTRHKRPPTLDRERRTVQEIHGAPSSLGDKPAASAARSGRDDLRHKLERPTSSSPALTAGDVDADWESADSSGDEAPGGDNPTPDQDVVDEIGRALGVEYDDDEELQGGDEIANRDRHRWELDPGSAEDSDDRD
jgi:Family of unknown function (DUF6335)